MKPFMELHILCNTASHPAGVRGLIPSKLL